MIPVRLDGQSDVATSDKLPENAELLRRGAEELHETLVDTEAPPKHLRCAELLREATGDFSAWLAEEPTKSQSQQSQLHDVRNLLNHVHQPLQRLERIDSESTFSSLKSQLAELRDLYDFAFDAVQRKFSKPSTAKPRTKKTVQSTDTDGLAISAHLAATQIKDTGRILIVDDDWKACRLLEETLEDYGHIATSCRRPERVIELLRDGPFDVCLLDVNMPTMSGWDLLQRIKSDPATTHTSVIVVSGTEKDESATKAITLGADDFISKPVNCSLLAARIANCLARSRQHLRELTKFLPGSVVDAIRRDPNRLRQGHEATVTVMFCDIRRFSRFSERMSPSETIRWISDVMEKLSQRILDDGGTLVDFVGDEVFAMWGAPQPSGNHADAACRCAMRMQQTVRELNQRWADVLGDHMEVGIGIHSGIVSVGNTGSTQRFKYGPLGNTVNLGSRVQGASKYLRSNVLITRDTRRQISRDMATRRLCSVRVQNIDRPVDLFELATDSSPKIKARDAAYEDALGDFEHGRFSEAMKKLAKMLSKDPEDGPSLLLMNRLIEAKLTGSAHFDPVWSLPGK